MIIKGIKIIKNKNFFDNRGHFKELLKEKNIKKKFPFIVMSQSKAKCITWITYSNQKFTRKIYIGY